MVDYSIVLIGFMGTGKSTIGRALSERLNLELIDTDDLVEKKMTMPISQIFKEYGEVKFRDLESDMLQEVSGKKNKIISCGGGVCLREENIINIKKDNKVILLQASPRVILDRIKADVNRPILKEKMNVDNIEAIIEERKQSYYKAADIIIDTDDKTLLEIVDEILTKTKFGAN